MVHKVGHKIVQSIGTVSNNSNTFSIDPGGNIDCTRYAGHVIRINVNTGSGAGNADFHLTNYKAGTVLNIVISDFTASATPVNTLHAPSGGTIDTAQSINLNSIAQYAFQIFIYDSTTAYSSGFALS